MVNIDRRLKSIVIGVSVGFLLSGAAGLAYEIIWMRMLGLVFGHSVLAVITVLTAFMTGLGLGSLLLGRAADSSRRPLALYGVVEAGIGVLCLLVPVLLPRLETVYLRVANRLGISFLTFSVLQFGMILLLLLPPTALMGGTLPIVSRLFVRDERTLGRRVGLLYALNTFGAVLGTAVVGYFVLPALGMRATLALAATLSIAVGVLMVAYDQYLHRLDPALAGWDAQLRPPAAPAPVEPAPPTGALGLMIVGIGLSGAASLVYEVAWTRALSLVIGSSTYAFTAMLLAFLLGIALGSWLFSRLRADRSVGPLAFGLIEGGIGASALVILPAFDKIPGLFLRAFTTSLGPGFVVLLEVALSVGVMLVPTLLIGASFPCAVTIAARRVASVGTRVGVLYGANTLGAIIGTIAAGFVLIPGLGVQSAVKVAVSANLLVTVAIAVGWARAIPRWQRWGAIALSLAIVADAWTMRPWDPAVMTSGVAIYTRGYKALLGKLDVAQILGRSRVLFYRDGPTATVTVHRLGEHTFLRVNGKTDASTGKDMNTQLMSGHLPLLLHPAPRTVLIIGLGSGVTVGAVARHDVERIDVVEIEAAVVAASRFFLEDNRNALADPRVHLVIADGRNFLKRAGTRYDVIISEPSSPWIGGLASLFSQEFFAIARAHLAPGGVMLQWIQGYGILPADLQMVVRTFGTAFPATSLWSSLPGDFLLVGQQQPRPLDLERITAMYERNAGLRDDMRRVGLQSPYALLADFVLGESDALRYAGTGLINTDDRLPLEFSAPRSLHLDTAAQNWRTVKSFRTADLPLMAPAAMRTLADPAVRYQLGLAYLRKGLDVDAAAEFERVLAAQPAHLAARLELGKIAFRKNLPLKAVRDFETVLRRDPRNAEACFGLARAYHAQLIPDEALRFASRAVDLEPANGTYQAYLAFLLNDRRRYAEAVAHYVLAREARPQDVSIVTALAATYLNQGKAPEAIRLLEDALAQRPGDPALLNKLREAYGKANQGPPPRPGDRGSS